MDPSDLRLCGQIGTGQRLFSPLSICAIGEHQVTQARLCNPHLRCRPESGSFSSSALGLAAGTSRRQAAAITRSIGQPACDRVSHWKDHHIGAGLAAFLCRSSGLRHHQLGLDFLAYVGNFYQHDVRAFMGVISPDSKSPGADMHSRQLLAGAEARC